MRLESSDLDAAAALLGVALVAEMPTQLTDTLELAPLGSRAAHRCSVLVSDVGQLRSAASERAVGRLRIGVLRGPCYVALRELVGADTPLLGGLVLCAEAGRSLDRRDVEDIAGLPILATVDVTPAVARTLDAGLAATRLARMREFAQLRRWLTSLVSGPSFGPDRGASGAVAFRSEPVETTCTDWHLPPGRKVLTARAPSTCHVQFTMSVPLPTSRPTLPEAFTKLAVRITCYRSSLGLEAGDGLACWR